ncbi:hypothetical protein F0562_032147 [Nyssa sinensis]|uniref:Uncharacterized protein n=1 Tax=Nyssa sinensis TaxID=561372 RepID=A0A5J5AW65_9ASTE|nr:hypothetical protein F0562_032147 [Nyssa sinensis]
MIIFSSKAYGILPLVPCAKAALTEKTVDPFLQLVDDSKLQAINTGLDHPEKVYGSKEDDDDALKALSEIEITEDHSRESFASVIVKMLEKSSDLESSIVKEQLVKDFLPDDVCLLGAQLFMETPGQIYQFGSKDNKSPNETVPPIFTIDDDVVPDASESQTDPFELTVENPGLLSVNQFLDSVLETTSQVGRFSLSTPSDMPYKEMANHCEALQMGKQQKISNFMRAQQIQECVMSCSGHDSNQAKNMPSYSHVEQGYSMGIDLPNPDALSVIILDYELLDLEIPTISIVRKLIEAGIPVLVYRCCL